MEREGENTPLYRYTETKGLNPTSDMRATCRTPVVTTVKLIAMYLAFVAVIPHCTSAGLGKKNVDPVAVSPVHPPNTLISGFITPFVGSLACIVFVVIVNSIITVVVIAANR